MKKIIILFIVMLFTGMCLSAQTIDTTFKGQMTAVKIKPFKATFNDTSNVTHIGVRIIGDDLKTSCIIYWALYSKEGRESMTGNLVISGKDYAEWSGDNLFLFKYSINKLNLKPL